MWFRKTLAMNQETGKYKFAAHAAAGSYFCHNKDTCKYQFAAHAAAGSYFCQSRLK
jgi:hypothetical protein